MKTFNLNLLEALYKLDDIAIDKDYDWRLMTDIDPSLSGLAGIYVIKSLDNSKYYVGQSIDLYRRLNEHRIAKDNDSPALHAVIKKLGADQFEYSIIETFKPDALITNESELAAFRNKLNEAEQQAIIKFESLAEQGGYNLTRGGNGGSPLKLSFEEINAVRKKFNYGIVDIKTIARQFKVDSGTIANIRDNVGVYSMIADSNRNLPTDTYRDTEQNKIATKVKQKTHAHLKPSAYRIIDTTNANPDFIDRQIKIFGEPWKVNNYFASGRDALMLIRCSLSDSSLQRNKHFVKDKDGNETGNLKIGGFILEPVYNVTGAPQAHIAAADEKAKEKLRQYYKHFN